MSSEPASLTSTEIEELQRLLSALGYRVHQANGTWTEDTRRALETYLAERLVQLDQPESKRGITPQLVDRLRGEVATLQLQLKVVGHYAGEITGVVDDATTAGLKAFEAREKSAHRSSGGKIWEHLDEQAGASFPDLLRAEVPEIDRARPNELKRHVTATNGNPADAAHEARFAGLAFSGGGIRSATFNLGVLQAISELKLLHVFDYLSTVSGGGYIGSWLSAFIKRRADGTPEAATPEISGKNVPGGATCESPAVRFLRAYSNYLTPRLGLLSADTLSAVATYLRNLYLNLLILTLILAALLMVPRILGASANYLRRLTVPVLQDSVTHSFVGWGIVLLGCCSLIVGANLGYRTPQDPVEFPWFTKEKWILLLFWYPGIMGAFIVAYWFNVEPGLLLYSTWTWVCAGVVLYFAIWLTGSIGYGFARWRYPLPPGSITQHRFSALLISAVVAGAVGGLLFLGFAHLLEPIKAYLGPPCARDIYGAAHTIDCAKESLEMATRSSAWLAVGFGIVIVLTLLSFVVALHVGLMGRRFSDGEREWWSRLGGFAIAFAVGWLALFAISIFAVPVVNYLGRSQGIANWIPHGALATWIAATISGVLIGRSPASGTKYSNQVVEIIGRIAPYIFIAGLLVGVAMLIDVTLPKILDGLKALLELMARYMQIDVTRLDGRAACADVDFGPDFPSTIDREFCQFNADPVSSLIFATLASLALGLALSWRVDINLFSLHNFYRYRLTRCYLGATRAPDRRPQPLTAFDEQDDLPLHDLHREVSPNGKRLWQRPYQIINTALNIVQGQALEWQQRKAASFVFTPLLSGFELPPTSEADQVRLLAKEGVQGEGTLAAARRKHGRGCYRPTARLMEDGVKLGSALAVSGAAASPNMGYHSSPALAFLMTVFNVRLGRWCGNPADSEAWKEVGPKIAAKRLLDELAGNTTSTSRFVYLSDGGHFENLGIYELVRRRCRFILSCDVCQDPGLHFDDLGNAIRKCQADLGIPIEIDVSRIRSRGDTKLSEWHCAVGAIRYDLRDPDALAGVLLYIKPSLVGDEPTDILQYASADPTFPHQSTGDQWFDEPQFESYRKLGYHIAMCALARAKEIASGGQKSGEEAARLFGDMEGLMVALKQLWRAPAFGGAVAFTRHAETLDSIYQQLRDNDRLRFLDAQIYPSWPDMVSGTVDKLPQNQWLPLKYGDLRAGFYVCNSMIQLMENVYLDLRLETEHDHPDNRGWMNLFHHWAWCNMFRVTWAMCAATYGTRFQSFCKRRLGLELGKVEVRQTDLNQALERNDINFLEKELVTLFTKEHEDTAGQLSLFHLCLVVSDPQVAADKTPGSVDMQFGIALAHDTDKGISLVYFRVQDHLRRMGLARRALMEMWKNTLPVRSENALPLTIPRERPNLTREAVGPAEIAQFKRLFQSVRYQMEQEEQRNDDATS